MRRVHALLCIKPRAAHNSSHNLTLRTLWTACVRVIFAFRFLPSQCSQHFIGHSGMKKETKKKWVVVVVVVGWGRGEGVGWWGVTGRKSMYCVEQSSGLFKKKMVINSVCVFQSHAFRSIQNIWLTCRLLNWYCLCAGVCTRIRQGRLPVQCLICLSVCLPQLL